MIEALIVDWTTIGRPPKGKISSPNDWARELPAPFCLAPASVVLAPVCANVKLPTLIGEPLAHLRHAFLSLRVRDRCIQQPGFLLGRKIPDLLRDLDRAELGAAHQAEVGGLGAFGGEGLVLRRFPD